MVQRKIATYTSDPAVTSDLQRELQQIFDTYKVFPEIDATVGYISLVPDSTWAFGLEPLNIWARHCKEDAPNTEYCYKPIVIVDAQTVRDKTVLIVADFLNANDVSEARILRIAPPHGRLVACNL